MKRFLTIAIVFALMVSMVFAVAACNNNNDVESIEITAVPTKTIYNIGDNSDFTGGKITVHKTDGTEEVLDFNAKGVSVSGFDTKTAGSKTLTVKYGNKTDTFGIVVVSKDVTISFAENNLPRTVFVKGQGFDKRGGELVVVENGNTIKVSFESSEVTVEGFDKDKVGKQTVMVLYHGGVTTLEVEVHEAVEFEDVQTKYYIGEPFNFDGTVWTTALDGTRTSLALNDKSVAVSFVGSTEFDSSKVGSITVKVTVSVNTPVEGNLVVEVIEGSLKEIIAPDREDYSTDDEKLDLTGGFVVLTGAEGEHKIPLTEDMVRGFSSAKTGITKENLGNPVKRTINVTYGAYKGSFDINMSYGQYAYVKEYADEFQKYYDPSLDQFLIPETLNDVVLQCLNIMMEEGNESFLENMTESETRSIVVSGAFILAEIWLSELPRFENLFVVDLDSGFSYTCETYEGTKAAYELMGEYVAYDGSDSENEYYNLFATEYMLDKLLGSALTGVVVYDYSYYYGSHDYDVNIESFFSNFCPYTSMSDLYNSIFKGFDVAFELYEDLKDSNLTLSNWEDDEEGGEYKELADDIYDYLLADNTGVINVAVANNNPLHLNRAIYNALVKWYAGSGESFDEDKSLFDIIYRIAFDKLDLTKNEDLLKLARMATYVQLPHLFEELYVNGFAMNNAINTINTLGATYGYFHEYSEFKEYLDGFYEEIKDDEFYQKCMANIFIAVQQGGQAMDFEDFIYTVTSAYPAITGSSYDDVEFTEYLDEYNEVAYTYLTEYSILANSENIEQDTFTYFDPITEGGQDYAPNAKFTEDSKKVVEGFLDLNLVQQVNFIYALAPNVDLTISVLALYYDNVNKDQSGKFLGWQASTPFAVMFDTYLRNGLNIDLEKRIAQAPTEKSEAEYVAANKVLEAYELYVRTYMIDGGVQMDHEGESNAQNLIAAIAALTEYNTYKDDIEKLVPGLYACANEAVNSLKATDRDYEVEEDVEEDYLEFIDTVALTYTSIVQMGYQYQQLNLTSPVYSAVLALGHNFIDKVEDFEALLKGHPELEKAYYYGVVSMGEGVDWNIKYAVNQVISLYKGLYYGARVSNGYLSKVITDEFSDFMDKSNKYFVESFYNEFFVIETDTEDSLAELRKIISEKEAIDAWEAFTKLSYLEQVNYMSLDSAMGMFFVSYIYYFADKLDYDVNINAAIPKDNIMANFIDVATYYTYWKRAEELEDDEIALSKFLAALNARDVEETKSRYDEAVENLSAGIESFKNNAESEERAEEVINYFKTTFANLIKYYLPDDFSFYKE